MRSDYERMISMGTLHIEYRIRKAFITNANGVLIDAIRLKNGHTYMRDAIGMWNSDQWGTTYDASLGEWVGYEYIGYTEKEMCLQIKKWKKSGEIREISTIY